MKKMTKNLKNYFLFLFPLVICFYGEAEDLSSPENSPSLREMSSHRTNPSSEEKNIYNLCYFSLNNEKEFVLAKRLMDRVKSSNPKKEVIVKEYQTKATHPKDSFRKMVEENTSCDGLVISGHHTGSFGGSRSRGSLSIDFLETLSCETENQDWFLSVYSVWLQGCRTLGSSESREENLADFHTRRVGEVLEEDHLEQDIATLNDEFSTTLDDTNPLSHRYRRLFPQSKVYGWTQTAPGKRAQSEYSLLYHIAQLMKLNNNNEFPLSPLEPNYKEEDLFHFEKVWEQLFTENTDKGYFFPVKAWKNHGKGGLYAFDNPDLNAYLPVFQYGFEGEDEKEFILIRKTNCSLKVDDFQNSFETLESILNSERLIGYSFNSILILLERNFSPSEKESIINLLRQSDELYNFLSLRLQSKRVGLMRKVKYLSWFYFLYSDEKEAREFLETIKEEVFQSIKKVFTGEGYERIRSYDLRDYRLELLEVLDVNHFSFGKEEIMEVLYLGIENENDKVSGESLEKALHLEKENDEDILKHSFFHSKNEFVRAVGLEGMVDLKGQKAWEIIEKGFEDDDSSVRQSSVKAAGKLGGQKAWKIIEKGFEDESSYVRWTSVEAAGKLGGQKAWKIIEKGFEDDDSSVRLRSVEAAGNLGEQKAWEIIEKGVKDEYSSVRLRSVKAAGKLGGQKAWKIIEKGFEDEFSYVRWTSVEVAGKLGGQKAWEIIEKGVKDEDPSVRLSSVKAAGKLGGQKAWKIIEKGSEDESSYVRCTSVKAAGKLGGQKAWKIIEKGFEDDDSSVRLRSVEAAGNLGEQKAWEIIEKGVKDEYSSVRQSSVKAAGKLGGQKAWEIIEKGSEDESSYVRRTSVEAAGNLGEQKAWEIIEKGFEDDDFSVRQSSVKAAGKLGGQKAWKIIEKGFEDEFSSYVRWTSVKAAGKLGGQKAWEIIEKGVKDEYSSVRLSSVKAAGKLGGQKAWKIIEKGVKDEYPSVRLSSVKAAEKLGGQKAWEIIERGVFDKDCYVREQSLEYAKKLNQKRSEKMMKNNYIYCFYPPDE